MSGGHRGRLAAVAVALLALVGCTQSEVAMIPPPPPTEPRPSTTAQPDYSGRALPPVPGRVTTTSIPLTGGKATLKGVVRGPDGLVPGATVVLERLVDDEVASGSVPTGANGAYLAPGIRGGRYRVRAFRSPDLAQVEPTILFLAGDEERVLDLRVDRYTGINVATTVAPNPPASGERTTLVVLVTTRHVDEAGVVTATPVAGVAAELYGAGSWRVETANPTSTDAAGRARWIVRCTQVGRQPLSVVLGGTETRALDIPPCTVPSDEGGPEPSTSTTAAGAASSTSTSRPRG